MTTSKLSGATRRGRALAGGWARAAAFRWLMGPQGHLLGNGPLYRLPENLKLTSDQRLLDISCGRGTLLRVLDEQVRFEVAPVGVDVSRELLTMGQRDEAGRQFAQAEAGALPFVNDAFTLVMAGYTVRQLDDFELHDLLEEIHRVLAPGGLALLWDFGPTGNPTLDRWNARVLGSADEPVRLRSSASLMAHANEAGFPFIRDAQLRQFLLPPIPRASALIGIPPEDWDGTEPQRA